MRVGDADAALGTAALVLREHFTYPRQTAAALETRGLIAVPPDPRGGELHLIGSTKCIHINRTILAPIFGIPLCALPRWTSGAASVCAASSIPRSSWCRSPP